MDQYVSEASNRGYLPGEIWRQDLDVSQDEKCLVVILRPLGVLNGDNPVGHVYQALNGHLQVSLCYILEVRLLVKILSALIPKGL